MGFRINTNIAAMNAHRNSAKTNGNLDKSLQSLSSGLRINTAADDASGLAIANSLRAQASGLGQAINNANDGIGVTQTADGALEEYENIVNTVRTKAIQAASDGQNTDSRAAIQRDIDKLVEEAQNISTTTSFNGQKLLDGSFQNKSFHIGAYKDETVNVSIASTQTNAIGAHANEEGVGGINKGVVNSAASLSVAALAFDRTFSVNGIETGISTPASADSGDNIEAHSAGSAWAKASAINSIENATNVHATAETIITGSNVKGGMISSGDLVINGIDIGEIAIKVSDANNSVMNAINNRSEETGVIATHDGAKIVLTSNDGSEVHIKTNNKSQGITGLGRPGDTYTGDSDVIAGNLAAGDLKINGIDIGPVIIAAGDTGAAPANPDGTTAGPARTYTNLMQAINDKSEETGVTASHDGAKMVLKSEDRSLINIETENNSEAITGLSKGLEAEVVDGDQYNSGKITLTSANSIDIKEGKEGTSGFGDMDSTMSVGVGNPVADSDVTTRAAAEDTIMIMDHALQALDQIRSEIGSTQNQLESTIRNISVTQVNVSAAESQIRDVDFAAESANFAKNNILAQSGSYAMSQANAVQQNVLKLLQ
ncbi:flagellin [Sulfurimonas sp.]|uniref:flagellin N-terminal helical domain-containing protein n=1 Tax=Sulfurimonas sp. TaxID=2022749 RepID=UPI0025FB58BC|nr:flagellin [Sulfurimonas sp.]